MKCKKPDVFRMPKQNNPETQTQTKNTTRRKTPSNLGETLRFQKDEILATLSPASFQLLNKGDKLVHPRPYPPEVESLWTLVTLSLLSDGKEHAGKVPSLSDRRGYELLNAQLFC